MKYNNSTIKTPMPTQDAAVRAHNFDEVALGYTDEMAINEARRCLHCDKQPCKNNGCPVGVEISRFIELVAEGDFEAAYDVIKASNLFPAVCGRVCPQENQCEKYCTRGIKGEPVAIGRLERFVADRCFGKRVSAASDEGKGHRAAIIGSGPAGLACAGALAAKGCEVTVFEALHTAGGVLAYGIPEFRLPKSIVKAETDALTEMGVEIRTNSVIGRLLSVDELLENGFESVFIGTGAGLPGFMGIKGENLKGVYSANEYLTRINLMKAYKDSSATPVMRAKNICVVGGGNVAMDAARCAVRMGADNVYIVYRRSEAELPARKEEIEHAKEEGIKFMLLTNPTEIKGTDDGFVRGMVCIDMQLGEPDASGRRRPVAVEGSEHEIACDAVIMALGTSPNPLIRSTTEGLETNKRGCIVAGDDCKTSKKGVFAGGDAVTGAATVILAMGAGKKAAEAMLDYMVKDK